MAKKLSNVTKLRPKHHPNRDFFVADIFDTLAIKDDIASMGVPMFSLSQKKDLRTITYAEKNFKIQVSPTSHGLPTIFDKDVLLYCGSLLMAEFNKGEIPSATLRISTHDLLVATNRETNGKSYKLIKKSLERLTGVSIFTDIKTNGFRQRSGFHLIESFHFIESNYVKDRHIGLEITLSDWFYNSIFGEEVLTISPLYFRLRKATERRLYELARRHCGRQEKWKIGLEKLKGKVGSTGSLNKFRYYIKQAAESNHLPDYKIAIKDDMITFSSRNTLAATLDELPVISQQAITTARRAVVEAGTGWDFDAIHEEFTVSLMSGFKPYNVDGAFINFAKKKVVNRP